MTESDTSAARDPRSTPVLRSFAGGVLMGLANLVPGVSGGTMILAIGLYDRFIGAVAELTTLRWSRALFVFLFALGAGLVVAILGGAGIAVRLVTQHTWIMYALFVGMALGGVPALFRLSRPILGTNALAALAGLGLMAFLAFRVGSSPLPHGLATFALVGALAASSMILPGISGSYILLVFGMYDVVIGSLSSDALRSDPMESLGIIAPVAVGAALGMALLSNLLKALLAKFSGPSHAFLLGLLLGSVLGLWPFQRLVHSELGERATRKTVAAVLEGAALEDARARYEPELDEAALRALIAEHAGLSGAELKQLAQARERFDPGPKEIGGALGLCLLGFLATAAMSRRETRPAAQA